MKSTLKTLLLLTAALAGVATQATAQVIHIQPKAIIASGQDIHLADVATITGTDHRTAETLANTVILSAISTNTTIKAESILMAIISQQGDTGLSSKLQVSGAPYCQLSLGNATGNGAYSATNVQFTDDSHAMAMTPTTLDATAQTTTSIAPSPKPVTTAAEPKVLTAAAMPKPEATTLSRLIVNKISTELQTPEAELRITFDTISPIVDEEIAPDSGKKWIFRPLTRTLLGSVQFEANLVTGTTVIKKLMVVANVEKKIWVLNATQNIARGDLLSKSQFSVEETYIDRKMPTLFAKDADVIGMECQRDVAVGCSLDQRDFKKAQLVSRNDDVTVMFKTGSVTAQIKGRASSNGKLHDKIAVKNLQTGEIYQATIIGRLLTFVGPALDETEEKQLRESHE